MNVKKNISFPNNFNFYSIYQFEGEKKSTAEFILNFLKISFKSFIDYVEMN